MEAPRRFEEYTSPLEHVVAIRSLLNHATGDTEDALTALEMLEESLPGLEFPAAEESAEFEVQDEVAPTSSAEDPNTSMEEFTRPPKNYVRVVDHTPGAHIVEGGNGDGARFKLSAENIELLKTKYRVGKNRHIGEGLLACIESGFDEISMSEFRAFVEGMVDVDADAEVEEAQVARMLRSISKYAKELWGVELVAGELLPNPESDGRPPIIRLYIDSIID